ncbi:MAG: hypothetical protein MRZ79_19115 [Bacteroidia bacterium]|nr:hypothetical protein [Bacteroidia bacterium]
MIDPKGSRNISILLAILFLFPKLSLKAQTPVFNKGEGGLKNMCEYVLNSSYKDRKKLTTTLIPDFEDCQAAFSAEKAKDIYKFIRRINQRHVLILTPEYPQQTQIAVWGAQKIDFETYQGMAKLFPGGYKEMAKYLKPEITYYLVRFSEPGHSNGATFDLLAYVNDHWCLFLSPWVPCMD